LDDERAPFDTAAMMMNGLILYGERCDARRNMARFYALEITADLLGGVRLERRWGRIGQHGRLAVDMYPSLSEAEKAMAHWRARKFSASPSAYRPKANRCQGSQIALTASAANASIHDDGSKT
jgi:predicted DNA-binding WGR domain protein